MAACVKRAVFMGFCLLVWEKSQPYMFCWLIYHQALTLKFSQAVVEKVLNPVKIFYYMKSNVFYKLVYQIRFLHLWKFRCTNHRLFCFILRFIGSQREICLPGYKSTEGNYFNILKWELSLDLGMWDLFEA